MTWVSKDDDPLAGLALIGQKEQKPKPTSKKEKIKALPPPPMQHPSKNRKKKVRGRYTPPRRRGQDTEPQYYESSVAWKSWGGWLLAAFAWSLIVTLFILSSLKGVLF